jgi:tetratricopeptide (TPR) repeat protein
MQRPVRLILILIMMFTFLPFTLHAAQVGKISKFKGTVQFRAKNNISYTPVKSAMDVSEGNWVKTGPDGWLELTLSDNSKFTMANNSEMEITSFMFSKKKREGSFNLTQGKLRASVVKFSGQSNITVKSGTAVAGVKGTEFLMMSEGPANVFFGNEGAVSVSGQGKESQSLTANAMTQNTRGYTPIDPVKIEPGTPLADARNAFNSATAAVPPADWMETNNLPNIVARWNIQYGHYLADSGKYDMALHVFQIALDLTKLSDIRCDARLERGAVYSRFLSNPESALAEYLLVLEEYPRSPQAETALYSAGQILYTMDFKEQAKARFQQYLKEYPQGKHRSNVDTLINLLDK